MKRQKSRTNSTNDLVRRQDLVDLEARIHEEFSHLPTKDEFYGKMDEVMGELKTIREEQILQSGKMSEITDILENHETRITRVEKRLKLSPITD